MWFGRGVCDRFVREVYDMVFQEYVTCFDRGVSDMV